jgi:hypothetical protein
MKRSIALGALFAIAAAAAIAGAAFSHLPEAITDTTRTTVIQSSASTPQSTTATGNITQQVAGAYGRHLANITFGNLTATTSGYEHNATIELSGSLMGPSDGPINVSQLYPRLYQWFWSYGFKHLNYSVRTSSGGSKAILNSSLTMYGNGPYTDFVSTKKIPGVYVATVKLDVSYARLGNSWLISDESWEFITMNFCTSFSSPSCSLG